MQGLPVHRFGQIVLHARLQAQRAFIGHGVGCDRNDGQIGEPGVLTNALRGLDAVHHGHLDVHQHRIKTFGRLGQTFERLLAIFSRDGLNA